MMQECWSAVVPPEVWERRLNNLKGIGVNAIRMSHNPQAPVLYELCDRLGFLVMDEVSDEWEFRNANGYKAGMWVLRVMTVLSTSSRSG